MKPARILSQTSRDLVPRWAVGIVLLSFGFATALAALSGPAPLKKYLTVLKQIHAEVKEMGPYPGEDFIRREFFVGQDDDDTNKDIHVIVLIQSLEAKEKMTIRVTEMVKDPGNPRARLAKTSKALTCLVAADRLEVQSSDYGEKDLAELVPEILTAIQNKKKLLNLGTAYQFPNFSFLYRLNKWEFDMVSRN
jgi:hypothetical protein